MSLKMCNSCCIITYYFILDVEYIVLSSFIKCLRISHFNLRKGNITKDEMQGFCTTTNSITDRDHLSWLIVVPLFLFF